jgi:hypothetical protein
MSSNVIFKNNCKVLPIIVSSWIQKMPGLSEFIDVEVPPNTEIELKSSVGEWIIGSLLYGKEKCNLWRSHNLEFDSRMAKFRNSPCAQGNYTWNFVDKDFDIVYENGVFVWSYIGEEQK